MRETLKEKFKRQVQAMDKAAEDYATEVDRLRTEVKVLKQELADLRDPSSEAHEKLLLAAVQRGAVTSKSVLKASKAETKEALRLAQDAIGVGRQMSDKAELAEGVVERLRSLLRRLTEIVAPAVAVLSRSPAVVPSLRAELADAEKLILGEVAVALAPAPSDDPEYNASVAALGTASMESLHAYTSSLEAEEATPATDTKPIDLKLWPDPTWTLIKETAKKMGAERNSTNKYEAAVAKSKDVLLLLNYRGGLGYDAHERIQQALSAIDAIGPNERAPFSRNELIELMRNAWDAAKSGAWTQADYLEHVGYSLDEAIGNHEEPKEKP